MKAWVGVLALSLVAVPLTAARVEIVLDVSGSMRASAGGVTRIEAAQRAVKATVDAIDASSNVALRLYGHRLPAEPKAASCRDTELVIPFGPLDRQRFTAAVQSAKPLGQTPLAYALEQAAADFGQVGNEPAAVILVSDGEESCGGDPAKVACAFRQRGLELTIHVVGFDVDTVAKQQLQSIASCTGGQYRDARNANELADSLRQLTQAGLLITKQREAQGGRVIRGGNGYDSAVPITPGTYRLDHHQRPGEYDYFSLDLRPGQIVKVSQDTYEVGVTIEGNTITENKYPTSGVAIHGPDRTVIDRKSAIGAASKSVASASVTAGKGGKYYILIGQDAWRSWGIHKESPFTIEITDVSDAGSGTDAGSSDREAVRIKPGRQQCWIQPGDAKDVFTFDSLAGATYNLLARPEGEPYSLQLAVTDQDGVQLASAYAPNPGAVVRLQGVHTTAGGPAFITVSQVAMDKAIPYTLELVAAGTVPAAKAPSAGASTASSSQAEAESKPSWASRITCGKVACGVAFLLAAMVAGVVVLIVFLLRRKRKPTP